MAPTIALPWFRLNKIAKIYLDKTTNIRYNITIEKTKGTPQSGYAQIVR
jgi:hypothetical protein